MANAASPAFGADGNMVRPLTWGEWKVLKVELLNALQGVIAEAMRKFADLKDDEARMQFVLQALTQLQGFEDLAVSRAIEPVTDETPVGRAQIIRTQGGQQIVEAAAADANFFAGVAEMVGPMLVKAVKVQSAANEQRTAASASGRPAGGPA